MRQRRARGGSCRRSRPPRGGKPRKDDIPVMVINPSCEQLALVPEASGGWRNATLEGFAALGFVQPTRDFPPTITEAEAEISEEYLIVTVTGYLPDMPDQEWAIKAARTRTRPSPAAQRPRRLVRDQIPAHAAGSRRSPRRV